MATQKAARKQPSSSSPAKGQGQDALTLLKADHAAVQALFKEFDKLCEQDAGEDEKEELAEHICAELSIHAQIEEEIFYPALREALEDDDILNEADVEHASAKDLISQILATDARDERFDAKLTVLSEYINHHVEEEQGEMFRQARRADVDLGELGRQLAQRKAELKTQMGLESGEEDETPEEPAAKTQRAASRRNGRDVHRQRA